MSVEPLHIPHLPPCPHCNGEGVIRCELNGHVEECPECLGSRKDFSVVIPAVRSEDAQTFNSRCGTDVPLQCEVCGEKLWVQTERSTRTIICTSDECYNPKCEPRIVGYVP